TVLSNSVDVEQNAPVARVKVQTADNRTLELQLRAGVDTAEWAHERPDVRAVIRHRLAPIFDENAADSFKAYRYLARWPFGISAGIEQVDITNTMPRASLSIAACTVFDSVTHGSTPLTELDKNHWRSIYDQNEVLILRNERALPRAWLVGEAEAVDAEETLR